MRLANSENYTWIRVFCNVYQISTQKMLTIISTSKLKSSPRHIRISHVCSLIYLSAFHMLVCLLLKEVSLNRHPFSTRLQTSRHHFFVDLITKYSLAIFKCVSLTTLCNYFFEYNNMSFSI